MKNTETKSVKILLYDVTNEYNTQDVINKMFADRDNDLCKLAIVRHNKDVDEQGNLKKSHLHCVIEFNKARRIDSIKRTFNAFGVQNKFIQPIRGDINEFLSYLLHKDNKSKEEGKYQYDSSAIIVDDFGLEKIKLVYRETLSVARYKEICDEFFSNPCKNSYDRLNSYYRQLIGAMPNYKACKDYYKEMTKNYIKTARSNKRINVLVHGKSGIGKDLFIKCCCKALGYQDDTYQTFFSDSLLESYQYQKVIHIQEFKAQVKYTRALNLLELWDNKMINCRYADKLNTSDMIFMSTSLPLNRLYLGVSKDEGDISELMRRLDCVIEIKDNNINEDLYIYVKESNNTDIIRDIYMTSKNEMIDFINGKISKWITITPKGAINDINIGNLRAKKLDEVTKNITDKDVQKTISLQDIEKESEYYKSLISDKEAKDIFPF